MADTQMATCPGATATITLHEAFVVLMERRGKKCPRCHSWRLSSDNSMPLRHRCLDCGWRGMDNEVVRPGESVHG